MRIDEIEYDEVTPEVDEYAGLTLLQRRRIEHFEEIGKPWLADAIRTSNGLPAKHPEPKRKTSNFEDIKVDNNPADLCFDDRETLHTKGCSVEKAMSSLKKIRINNDKFI